MRKNDVWDEEINPDFISDPLENLNSIVWDRGYFKETDDGIWYEVYVNEKIKQKIPKIDLKNKNLLEIGSGESTVYWSNYFGQVCSYEDDPQWASTINVPDNVDLVLYNP